MKILIAEDSHRLRDTLKKGLTHLGYTVDDAEDGQQAISCIDSCDYEVVILDLMMPIVDGYGVLRYIKKHNKKCPVIILSAKEDVSDKIMGLKLGADDYLAKPFSFDELEARISALIRRNHKIKSSIIVIDDFTIDLDCKHVSVLNNNVALTPNEYLILEYLILNRGRIVSFSQIESAIYDSAISISKNTIETYISTIRKKLKQAGMECLISTKRNFGYSIP
ncbi:MAG: DNA-binding response OmpR family regulator [Oceanicoccus sp.]